ncbi:hypothetical protein [Streptomyces sp. NPDC018352]
MSNPVAAAMFIIRPMVRAEPFISGVRTGAVPLAGTFKPSTDSSFTDKRP